ncbi:hypothetical protein [uncultured Dialister sp.]|uniref:hypothetical protein n=1 Tax=uncultured Dialister sp. TaxID=278064 RepID=UPI0025F68FEE|nr:hypothetical protein [uncultured Dialister sp.]
MAIFMVSFLSSTCIAYDKILLNPVYHGKTKERAVGNGVIEQKENRFKEKCGKPAS